MTHTGSHDLNHLNSIHVRLFTGGEPAVCMWSDPVGSLYATRVASIKLKLDVTNFSTEGKSQNAITCNYLTGNADLIL